MSCPKCGATDIRKEHWVIITPQPVHCMCLACGHAWQISPANERCAQAVVPGKLFCWLHGGHSHILPYRVERRLRSMEWVDLFAVLCWLSPPTTPEAAATLERRAVDLWRTLTR